MCSWLRPDSIFSLILPVPPKEIQEAFKSHYCSKHPDIERDDCATLPTASRPIHEPAAQSQSKEQQLRGRILPADRSQQVEAV